MNGPLPRDGFHPSHVHNSITYHVPCNNLNIKRGAVRLGFICVSTNLMPGKKKTHRHKRHQTSDITDIRHQTHGVRHRHRHKLNQTRTMDASKRLLWARSKAAFNRSMSLIARCFSADMTTKNQKQTRRHQVVDDVVDDDGIASFSLHYFPFFGLSCQPVDFGCTQCRC